MKSKGVERLVSMLEHALGPEGQRVGGDLEAASGLSLEEMRRGDGLVVNGIEVLAPNPKP